jgi:FAD/FMN-containing dehydrogenase
MDDRLVNDIHSQLNATKVAEVVRPACVEELQVAVRRAAAAGRAVSVCGGRHAMGGQQFGRGTTLVDTSCLTRVCEMDQDRGLITVEAGIQWPQLLAHLLWTGTGKPGSWTFVQKQTGADRLSIGGALAANIHGRGLCWRPFVQDIESFDLVDATGSLITCSRTRHPTLFSLAVGGYGLFGIVARVTLRLTRRHKLQRHVAIVNADSLPSLFDNRIREGYEFGDFQCAIEPTSREFLRAGVFACYKPIEDDAVIAEEQVALSERDWRHLLLLAHTNKSRAFAEYARHYMRTDRQIYWSDTHQMSDYFDGYHQDIDRQTDARCQGSEMISELYVPRPALPQFLGCVREDARRYGLNIIYSSIRLIERDDETVLAWAREPWACMVVNLHVDHDDAGVQRAVLDFRRLIDRALEFDGSYYLTYHRWATAEQVRAAHPRIGEFLAHKRRLDPAGVFQSDWYHHHARLLGACHEETPGRLSAADGLFAHGARPCAITEGGGCL